MTFNANTTAESADEPSQQTRPPSDALLEILDRIPEAVVILTRLGQVAYCNEAARRILRRAAGISAAPDRRLSLACAHARGRLARALRNGTSEPPIVVARPAQQPLVLKLYAFSSALRGTFGAAALMFISDPEAGPGDCTAVLRSAFGLTSTEARLVQALSEGAPLKTIARRHQISYETARTHLRHILNKTGARRQAELVRITHALQ